MTQPTPETDAYYGVLPNSDAQVRGRKPERDFARTLERQRDEAVELLRKCCTAIEEEGNCGDEDHPVIRAHLKIAHRARAFLERMKEEK